MKIDDYVSEDHTEIVLSNDFCTTLGEYFVKHGFDSTDFDRDGNSAIAAFAHQLINKNKLHRPKKGRNNEIRTKEIRVRRRPKGKALPEKGR